jgi:hypothetical protein
VVYESPLSLLLCALIGFLWLCRSGIGPALAPSVTSCSNFWVSPLRPISSSQCPLPFIPSFLSYSACLSIFAHLMVVNLLFFLFRPLSLPCLRPLLSCSWKTCARRSFIRRVAFGHMFRPPPSPTDILLDKLAAFDTL